MLHLTKHQGLGNDFLVALAADNPGLVPDAARAVRCCDRRRGVGADGLICGMEPTPADRAAGVDIEMVLHNADGSLAEISGNGIRCLAQAVLRRRGVREGSLLIRAGSGLRRVETVAVIDDDELRLRVEMGEVRPGPPLSGPAIDYPAHERVTLDVGNPHLVLWVDDPAAARLCEVGPQLESGFAEGVNVHLIAPAGVDIIDLVVWERGAGITEACGSGATVAAVAAHRWGLVGDRVTVRMPGGDAVVELAGDGTALVGPAVFVAEVAVSDRSPAVTSA